MEYKFETVNCNLCNSNNYQSISKKGKFGLPTNVVICRECGLSFLNPRWDHNSYLQFYQNDYDKYYRPKISKIPPLLNEQINPIEIRLKKFNLLPENVLRILDIGSGEGNNLLHFKSLFQNSKLYAIEPSVESQNHLKKYNVTIIESDVDTSWDLNHRNKFDIIIMRHVLEHFLDPIKIMKKVHNVLTSSGIVYIAVPNNLNPTENLEKSWFRNVHTYYFNKYSLLNLSKIVGFEILKLVEGDDFNRGEVYLVAKKSKSKDSPIFSIKHYEEQLSVLKEKLRKDNSIKYQGISIIKKIRKKLISLTKTTTA
jgi:SAM-dependent methyltransferase